MNTQSPSARRLNLSALPLPSRSHPGFTPRWLHRPPARSRPSGTPAAEPAHHTMPGLDGLRALAVVSVILYHLNVTWASGGLLGVTLFFVLSGYLITDLLLSEHGRTGRISLRQFWIRRARRLLPALFTMLAFVLAYMAIFDRSAIPPLRGQILAATLYVSNWYLIFHHVSYFASFGPLSPLGHLWSLAIEEQFYLLWPLLLILGLRLVRSPRSLAGMTLALAALSALLMAALYVPGLDPTRVYDGTDTRAFSLLIGCALAFVWPSIRIARIDGRRFRIALNVLGGIALLAILVALSRTDEYQTFLYRGGMALFSVAAAVVIAALTHPGTIWAQLFGLRPLRWIGVRSYGIYLWHYPVILLASGALYGSGPVPLLRAVPEVAVSILLAALSWHWIENPVLHGALGRFLARFRTSGRLVPRTHGDLGIVARLALGGVVLAVAASGLTGVPPIRALANPAVTAHTTRTRIRARHRGQQGHPVALSALAPASRTLLFAQDTGALPFSARKPITAGPRTPGRRAKPGAAPDRQGKPPGKPSRPSGTRSRTAFHARSTRPHPAFSTVSGCQGVTAIGDSIMIDASPDLHRLLPGIVVDGVVGRQMIEAPEVLTHLRAQGKLGTCLIVELGTNGSFPASMVVTMLRHLGPMHRIVLVNTRVPRPWQDVVNETLAQVAREVPRTVLVNWYAASAHHPGYFWPDGVHLDPAGAHFFAALLIRAVEGGTHTRTPSRPAR